MSFTRKRMGGLPEPIRSNSDAGETFPDPSRICAYRNYTPTWDCALTTEYDRAWEVVRHG